MCTIILLGIEELFNHDKTVATLEGLHRAAFRVDNASLREQQPGLRFYIKTKSGCDCDSYIGRQFKQENFEAEVRKLRKKNWSEAKIARWVADKTAKNESESLKYSKESQDEWADHQSLFNALFNAGAKNVALLFHVFNGNVQTENIAIQTRISLGNFSVDDFLQMRPDTLYTFNNGVGR